MISSSYSGFADLLRCSSMTLFDRHLTHQLIHACWRCSPACYFAAGYAPRHRPFERFLFRVFFRPLTSLFPYPSLTVGLVLRAPLTGDIELRNVAFTYQMRSDRPVLRDLSLHIRPGQVRCVGDVVACGVCLYATGNLDRLLLLPPLFASSTLEILGWLPHVSMLRF
jgi:hypothetical protein